MRTPQEEVQDRQCFDKSLKFAQHYYWSYFFLRFLCGDEWKAYVALSWKLLYGGGKAVFLRPLFFFVVLEEFPRR